MELKHTATPWTQDRYGNVKDQGGFDNILITGFSLNTGHRSEQATVNTAFIVRACNAHDDLVKALQAICLNAPKEEPEYQGTDNYDDIASQAAEAEHYRLAKIARAALAKVGAA